MILRCLLLSLLLGSFAIQLPAQHLIGLAGSNRAGSQAAILNPSAIADSRHGFHLNLFTGHAAFSNTYFYYDGPRIRPGAMFGSKGKIVPDKTPFWSKFSRA